MAKAYTLAEGHDRHGPRGDYLFVDAYTSVPKRARNPHTGEVVDFGSAIHDPRLFPDVGDLLVLWHVYTQVTRFTDHGGQVSAGTFSARQIAEATGYDRRKVFRHLGRLQNARVLTYTVGAQGGTAAINLRVSDWQPIPAKGQPRGKAFASGYDSRRDGADAQAAD